MILLAPICPSRISGPLFSVQNLAECFDAKVEVISTLSGTNYNRYYTYLDALTSRNEDFIVTGIWHPRTLLMVFILSFRNRVVVSTRGNLVRASLSKSFWKKIVPLVFMRLIFSRIHAFHYLSDLEKRNSISLGVKKSIVIPNRLPLVEKGVHRAKDNVIVVGWLGRFDWGHKGIDRLIDIVANGKEFYVKNKICFHFAGTDYRGGREKFIEAVNKRDLNDIVEIQGELKGSDKLNFMSTIDCLIYASRYEGVPQVVGEAQMHGLPCALSIGCNIPLESNVDLALKFSTKNKLLSEKEFYEWLLKVKYLLGKRTTIYNRDIRDYSCEFINKCWAEVFS